MDATRETLTRVREFDAASVTPTDALDRDGLAAVVCGDLSDVVDEIEVAIFDAFRFPTFPWGDRFWENINAEFGSTVAFLMEIPFEAAEKLMEEFADRYVDGPMGSPGFERAYQKFQSCHVFAADAFKEARRRILVEIARVFHPPFDYHVYLLSPEWKAKRDARVEADGGRCVVCCSGDHLNVHHRTYERIGRELPCDLVTLCADCHKLFHENGRLAPEPRALAEPEASNDDRV